MNDKETSRTRRVSKAFFNPKVWFDYDRVRSATFYLRDTLLKLFVPNSSKQTENLNDAMKRLDLSADDIKNRKSGFLRLSLLMLVLALLILAYTVYLLVGGHFHAAALSGVVCMFSLTMSFRYHFWYFQLCEGKLGCSIREWFRKGLLGAKQ
jgi:intracellular multiplication protein IcmV